MDEYTSSPKGELINEQKKLNKIRIFKSFQEQEDAEIEDILKQAPIDRIRETVALILRVYGVSEDDLKNKRKKLYLKKI